MPDRDFGLFLTFRTCLSLSPTSVYKGLVCVLYQHLKNRLSHPATPRVTPSPPTLRRTPTHSSSTPSGSPPLPSGLPSLFPRGWLPPKNPAGTSGRRAQVHELSQAGLRLRSGPSPTTRRCPYRRPRPDPIAGVDPIHTPELDSILQIHRPRFSVPPCPLRQRPSRTSVPRNTTGVKT